MNPQPDEVFYDLGCGTGLPSAIAAIMFPELRAAEGAEYLEVISELGALACAEVQKSCAEQDVRIAPLNVRQGDVLEIDWSHADIIICNNVTWDQELIR